MSTTTHYTFVCLFWWLTTVYTPHSRTVGGAHNKECPLKNRSSGYSGSSPGRASSLLLKDENALRSWFWSKLMLSVDIGRLLRWLFVQAKSSAFSFERFLVNIRKYGSDDSDTSSARRRSQVRSKLLLQVRSPERSLRRSMLIYVTELNFKQSGIVRGYCGAHFSVLYIISGKCCLTSTLNVRLIYDTFMEQSALTLLCAGQQCFSNNI